MTSAVWLLSLVAGLGVLASGTAACSQAAPANDRPQVHQSLELRVPVAPARLILSTGDTLVYELHVTNFASRALRLNAVDVIDGDSGEALLTLTATDLAAVTGRPGLDAVSDRLVMAEGMRAIVYLSVPRSKGGSPRQVGHRVTWSSETVPNGATEGGRASVDVRPVAVLAPPLRGGPWTAVYDAAMERGHRRVVYATEGEATIPGRFAVDWMRASGGGDESGAGDPSGLAAEVLAVADGTVVALSDGVPEPAAGAARTRVTLRDAPGNHVVLDIGDGRYAFYEHLMPGLSVSLGDRVRVGQVIGRVGSTGSASRPHLHFHLADRPSPLGGEGVPYVLSDHSVLGSFPSISAFEAGEAWQVGETRATTPTFPGPNAVVVFPP